MAAQELRYLYCRGRDLDDARRRLHDVLQRCAFSDVRALLRLARSLDAWQEELTAGSVSNGPTEAPTCSSSGSRESGSAGTSTSTGCDYFSTAASTGTLPSPPRSEAAQHA